MTVSLTPAAQAVDPLVAAGFEVGYVGVDGAEHRVLLREAWQVPFEDCLPVRRFRSRKGQRHLSGLWWCATTGHHVGFESWLERDHVMLLDFDAAVTGVVSQPFWLYWPDADGRVVSHAPDFFARRVDGSGVVVDCRPVGRRPGRDVARFDATRRACELLGWEYRLVGAPDATLTANARWLSGYRHPRHRLPEVAGRALELFARTAPLLDGAEAVGDPLAVLPVLFHLLWSRELVTDLSVPLSDRSLVAVAGAR